VARTPFALLGAVVVAGWLCSPLTAQGSEPELTRLKPADPEMRRLIFDGHARSATFRDLVDEVQRSNAIVVVQFGLCANGRIRSCVSNVDGDATRRHIRIKVNTKTTDDRLIATIAHELQHAVEILSDPGTVDAHSTLLLYRRIGTMECRNGLTDRCETEAALQIESLVNRELSQHTSR